MTHFSDQSGLVAFKEIDVVLIATPHYSHVPIGMAALGSGLHVLMEKPLAAQKADAERLLSQPLRQDQVFALMFNQRGDPAYLKIRELLQSNALGRVQRIQWTITDWFRPNAYFASNNWRATWAGDGSGVLLNQCPHTVVPVSDVAILAVSDTAIGSVSRNVLPQMSG